MKQETPSQKRLCLSKASVIAVTIFVLAVFGIALFMTYRIASPPMEYGIAHPLYADYAGLFYNVKCSYTKANFTEYDILDKLYYLGIPKDRARELFTEARENVEKKEFMHDMVGVEKNCYQETLDYYDKALNVLKYLDSRSSRIRDGFPGGAWNIVHKQWNHIVMNIQTVRNSFSSVARITNADNEEKGFSHSSFTDL